MKRSNSKNKRDLTAFLYERLSRDDDLEGESYSIAYATQPAFLHSVNLPIYPDRLWINAA